MHGINTYLIPGLGDIEIETESEEAHVKILFS